MTVSKKWLREVEEYWRSDEGRAYEEWFWSDDDSPQPPTPNRPTHPDEHFSVTPNAEIQRRRSRPLESLVGRQQPEGEA